MSDQDLVLKLYAASNTLELQGLTTEAEKLRRSADDLARRTIARRTDKYNTARKAVEESIDAMNLMLADINKAADLVAAANQILLAVTELIGIVKSIVVPTP